MRDRRMATPKRTHYRQSAEREILISMALNFAFGILLGVVVTIGYYSF